MILKKYIALIVFLLVAFMHTAVKGQSKACDLLIKESQAAIGNKEYVKALEILSAAKDIAEENNSYTDIFCVLTGMGESYYYMNDYGESLNFTLEAYDVAVKHLEPRHQHKSMNNIGVLYLQEKNYEKAEEYCKKAYDATKAQKNFMETGYSCMTLASIAYIQKDFSGARSYYEEAIVYFKDKPKLKLKAEIGLVEVDLAEGRYVQARDKALDLYPQIKVHNYHGSDISLLKIIAESYFKEKDYGKAEENAFKVLAVKPDAETKKGVYELLTNIYNGKKEYQKALQYKDSVLATERLLNDLKSSSLFESSKVKLEIANYKNEIVLKDERMASERKIFYSLLAILAAIVTIVILVLRQKRIVSDRNRKIAELELEKKESENLLLEKQIHEKQVQTQLEEERLRNEIESRNRKLSAKALYLSGRNELVEEIINSVAQIPQVSQNQEVSTYMRTLKGYLKTDAEWDDFIAYFEQVNPQFLRTLQQRHPALTFADIRFICYIYMNLDLKEISAVLNITTEASKKRKQRIAKKMEIDADDLHDYILKIS